MDWFEQFVFVTKPTVPHPKVLMLDGHFGHINVRAVYPNQRILFMELLTHCCGEEVGRWLFHGKLAVRH
jgi:hypothetical protein